MDPEKWQLHLLIVRLLIQITLNSWLLTTYCPHKVYLMLLNVLFLKSVFMGFNSNWSLSESECEITAHSLLNRIHLSLELSTYFEVILRLLFIKFFFLDFLMCMCVSASPIPELICSSSYQSHAPKWSNYSLSDTLPAPNGTSRFHFVIVIHYHPG